MATTIEELRAVMRMELKPFQRDLQQMNGINARAARQVERTWLDTNRRLDGIGKNMAQSLIAPLTGVGAALGARELIRLTDTWTDLNGRVRIAAGGMREGADVMERLSDMARRTYSSLETTAESYLTNSQALKELGYSTNQQLDFTEALNNALVVSGAKGQRAEQVINALGKAMAFGELRGENLNTVIQTGGRVAQALAEGLGVTTNELRKLGEQGKLKSSNVFAALTSQMQTLRDEADGMQATIGDALQLLNNSFLEYVGGADQAAGASARIAEAIILVADNMDTVASAALFAAQAIIGALVGRAMVGAGIQILSTGKALADFVRIARTAQTLGGLGPAFASLGAQAGVIGLVVGGAAALALGYFASQAMEAARYADIYNAELERMKTEAKAAAGGVDEVTAATQKLTTAKTLADAAEKAEATRREIVKLDGALQDALLPFQAWANTMAETDISGKASDVVDLTDAFVSGGGSAKDLTALLDDMALSGDMTDAAASLSGYVQEMVLARDVAAQVARSLMEIDQFSFSDLRAQLGPGPSPMTTDLGSMPKWNTPATFGDFRAFANPGGKKLKGSAGSKADPYGEATKSMQDRIDALYPEHFGVAA